MNKPLSACTTFTEELVSISDTLSTFRAHSRVGQTPSPSLQTGPLESSSSTTDHDSPSSSPMDIDPPSFCAPSSNSRTRPDASLASGSPYIEVHPGAGKVLGHGSTFMDGFEADLYAEERRELPYYPFTSRDEWELASFLLRSSLSMKAIDTFLSLKMVSQNPFPSHNMLH